MARASTYSRIPAAYRQPLLGKPDPRLARCLTISSGVGAIVLFGILVTPARHVELEMDDVPRRLAKLILEPPKVVQLQQPEARPESSESIAQIEPAPEASAEPASPQVQEALPQSPSGVVGQRRLEATRQVDSGSAGREQANREVRASLSQTQKEVKQTLTDVAAVLSAIQSDSPTSSAPRRARPGGGRKRESLEQVDAVKAAGPGTARDEPITAGLLDIGSITDVRTDLASTDPSIAGSGTVGGRRNGRDSGGSTGSVEPSAYRSNASLLAVVRRYAPGIQYCYDNELKRDLTLNGKMVLVLTVLASGLVSEVTIAQDSVGSSRLEECVLAQVREWRFPTVGEGTVTFRTPFVFTPPES